MTSSDADPDSRRETVRRALQKAQDEAISRSKRILEELLEEQDRL